MFGQILVLLGFYLFGPVVSFLNFIDDQQGLSCPCAAELKAGRFLLLSDLGSVRCSNGIGGYVLAWPIHLIDEMTDQGSFTHLSWADEHLHKPVWLLKSYVKLF